MKRSKYKDLKKKKTIAKLFRASIFFLADYSITNSFYEQHKKNTR